jgi:hypothetical protein
VNNCGIRLDLCNQDGAFIAIPSRMIDRFDRQNIDSVVSQFRANSSDPPIYQSIPVWSNAPDGAIRFQNVIPVRVSQKRNIYLYMLIVIASTVVGCMVLIILDLNSVIAVMVAVSVCAGAELYRVSAHVKRSDLSYGRWGWLTAEGCESRLPESKYAFDWLDPTELEFDENGVRAKFDNGGEFWLAPDDVMSDDWSKLTDWIESRRSSKHDSTGLLQ